MSLYATPVGAALPFVLRYLTYLNIMHRDKGEFPNMKLMRIHALICFATVLLSAPVFGQRTTGTIEGTVTDPSGAVVPGVGVSVTGITVGFERTVQSNEQGIFRVQQIPAGTYKVATTPFGGFTATTVENVAVTIENVAVVNIKLGLSGAVSEVFVTEGLAGVNVDTTDSRILTSITAKLIDELPKGTRFD